MSGADPFALKHYDPAVGQVRLALQMAKDSGAAASVVEALEKASDYVDRRETFAHECTSAESPACRRIEEKTKAEDWVTLKKEGKTIWGLTPRMMTGPLEGQFLKSLVSLQQAKRVLDIGMFTGYSALSMAEALPADGEMVTVDMDPFLGSYVEDLLKDQPHGNKVKILIGKSKSLLSDMVKRGEKFDLIFLDADKSEYIDYMETVFDQGLLNARGSVLVDNMFQHGRGYLPSEETTPAKQFAAAIRARKDLHKSMVPLRDGVLIMRRMSDVEGEA